MTKEHILRELEHLLGDRFIVSSPTIDKIDAILSILYPNGIELRRYADMIRTVRVLERLCQTTAPHDGERAPVEPPSDVAIVKSVEDDATAPLLKGPLFTRSPKNKNASTSMTGFGLRRRQDERQPRLQRIANLPNASPEPRQSNDMRSTHSKGDALDKSPGNLA